MIRQANQQDHILILNYLKSEASINTMLLVDILNNGYENPNVKTFLQYNENKLISISLIYYTSMLFYTKESVENEELANHIKSFNPTHLMGEKSSIETILKFFTPKENRACFFAQMPISIKISSKKIATKATKDDATDLLNSQKHVFGSTDNSNAHIKRLENELLSGVTLNYVIKKDGKIVAAANTNTITNFSATITGVFCLEEYRNHGYATEAISALCEDLLSRKVIPNLFYDNPSAGSIYLKLGFEQLADLWSLVILR